MTASTVKGTQLTAQLITEPRSRSNEGVQGGRLKVFAATEALATTSIDEVNDVVLLVAIPSSAVPHSVVLRNDDIDTHATATLAFDVGIYNGDQKFTDSTAGTKAAYAVLDADAFASAVLHDTTISTADKELRYEAANITSVGQHMWELAGLAEDPNVMFTVGIKITTAAATAAAGDMSIVILATD